MFVFLTYLIGFFERSLFYQAFKFIKYGFFNKISILDTPDILKTKKTKKLFNQAEHHFNNLKNEQKIKSTKKLKKNKKFSNQMLMIKLVWRMHSYDIIIGIILSVFHALMATVARPLLLREIIILVRNASDEDFNDENLRLGFIYAILISLTVVLEGFLGSNFRNQFSVIVGSQFLSWGMSLVNSKSTKISSAAYNSSFKHKSKVTNLESKVSDDKKIVTEENFATPASLVGSDFIRLFEDWRRMSQLPSVITSFIGGLCVLIWTLKISSLLGIAVMFCVITLNFRIIKILKAIEEKDFKKGDERILILTQLLEGIKAIKLTAWENSFKHLLFKVRKEETYFIRKYRLLQVTSMNLGRVSPALASCFSILLLVGINEADATPEVLFVAMASFLSLRLPLVGIPLFTSFLANTLVGFQRIGDFLMLPEHQRPSPHDDDQTQVYVKSATFTYDLYRDRLLHSDLGLGFEIKINDFVIKNNDFVAVVGRVGSGKSSLLKSILGETLKLSGTLNLSKSVAFVPQQPFVLSGTIKENILLGKDYEPEWFQTCLKLSEFEEDLALISKTLKEELQVGERGQTLSGGQKQRLAICRALYSKSDLLILDDPLSAVDSLVAQKIFFNLKSHFKKEKKALLMTLNQFYFLQHFDEIHVMKEGKIIEKGAFKSLALKQDGYLKEMLNAVDLNVNEETDEFDGQISELNVAKIELETEEVVTDNNSKVSNDQDSGSETVKSEEQLIDPKKETDLFEEDYSKTGAVGIDTFIKYISAMGHYTIPVTIMLGTVTYAVLAFNDKRVFAQISATEVRSEMLRLSYLYLILSLVHVFFIQAFSYHQCFSAIRAGRTLHNRCIDCLLKAPITWFESNPSGRIISRFSGDLSLVDRTLQFIFDDLFQFFFMISALSTVVSIILPQVVPVLIFGALVFLCCSMILDKSNREVKRFANQNLAPLLTNINETESAKLLIQAMRVEDYFSERQMVLIDDYIIHLCFSNYLSNWMMFISGFVSFSLSITVATLVINFSSELSPSDAGLALTYTFLIPYFLQFVAFQIILGLSGLTSLERILEYLKLPKEPEWYLKTDDSEELKFWPKTGKIKFENVQLIYRKGLEPALKKISFETKESEKVGVVGRTGAGKSSLTLLLFRVHECTQGKIYIDGQDITKLGLQKLRSNLSSIPQHPLLLRGTVRKNLDPFDDFEDSAVNKVIQKIGLTEDLVFMPAKDLSIGQRQLISLGRILLRKLPKIIVMDEPTANIDQETDQTIQKLLREEFKEATLLMIAHRLDTVIDSDRILVMEAGYIVEFDKPETLLENENGTFYEMVSSMGEVTLEKMRAKAKGSGHDITNS